MLSCEKCSKIRGNSGPVKDSELPTINVDKKSEKNYAIVENGRFKTDKLKKKVSESNKTKAKKIVDKDDEDEDDDDDPNDQIYMSYGKGNTSGNFRFKCSDDRCKYDMLTDICNQGDYYFKTYALVEKKTTEFYTLIFDLDFHEKHKGCETYIDLSEEIVKLIIGTIDIVLQELFVKSVNKKYLYCDKSEGGGKGIHLYYPHIIINKIFHSHIYNNVLNRLINTKKFDLTENMWKNIFDACVSNTNSLRLPYFNVNNSFYKQNAEMSTIDVPEYDGKADPNILKMCCVRTNKTAIYPKPLIEIFANDIIVKKNKSTNISKTKQTNLLKTYEPINKISLIHLDKLLSCISIKKFIDYSNWFKIKFVVYNCNNSKEACIIFHKHCAIGPYKDITYQEIEKEFMNTKSALNFEANVLYCYARNDDPIKFNSLNLDIKYDPQNFKTKEFTSSKITKLKNEKKNTTFEDALYKFIDKKSKIRCISLISPYGTGKSYCMHDLISKVGHTIQRICIITSKISLAKSFEEQYRELGFNMYLNKSKFSSSDDRIIINMDSLRLLYKNKDYCETQTLLQSYDLIIVDEIASILNNFESSLMNDRQEIHSIFHRLIRDTKKTIAMDGDFSNREYNYLCDVLGKDKIEVYQNLIKPENPCHITFSKDENKFLDDIEADLIKKRNISVASMSSSFALGMEKYFTNLGYNVLCITGESSNETKKLLVDPQKLFVENNKIQLFIYSPTITVGIDINIKYFYRQYGYICKGSINARDYCQMLARIRQFENYNVQILVNQSISTKKYANFYSVEEVITVLCTDLQKDKYDLNIFDKLRMYNYMEDINSSNYLFQVLIHLINKKHHTYEIQEIELNADGIKEKKKIEKGDIKKKLIENIVNAENISCNQFSILLKKQRIHGIDISEQYSIEKYMYMNKFNIKPENLTTDILEIIYGKRYIVDNYNKLVKNNEVDDKKYIDDEDIDDADINDDIDNDADIDDNEENDLTVEIKNKRMEKIVKIINTLGFKISDNEIVHITLNKELFDKNKIKLKKIINPDFNLLFKLKKSYIDYTSTSNKKILGCINTLFNNYGLKIKWTPKQKKTKKIKINIYEYELRINEIVDIYLKNKSKK
jgi:hypothetical protein